MNCSLNSLKGGGYRGLNWGTTIRVTKGILGVYTIAHIDDYKTKGPSIISIIGNIYIVGIIKNYTSRGSLVIRLIELVVYAYCYYYYGFSV